MGESLFRGGLHCHVDDLSLRRAGFIFRRSAVSRNRNTLSGETGDLRFFFGLLPSGIMYARSTCTMKDTELHLCAPSTDDGT
jgi:hypothetical protein